MSARYIFFILLGLQNFKINDEYSFFHYTNRPSCEYNTVVFCKRFDMKLRIALFSFLMVTSGAEAVIVVEKLCFNAIVVQMSEISAGDVEVLTKTGHLNKVTVKRTLTIDAENIFHLTNAHVGQTLTIANGYFFLANVTAPKLIILGGAIILGMSNCDIKETQRVAVGSTVNAASGAVSESTCSMCAKSCTKRCSVCKKVFYCSQECQKADWKEHKRLCKK